MLMVRPFPLPLINKQSGCGGGGGGGVNRLIMIRYIHTIIIVHNS